MLINRVKVIVLCGGWMTVVAAQFSCGGTLQLPTKDPRTKCNTVATNSTWIDKVGSIVVDITDPRWCPVIIDGPPGTVAFQNYSANVQLSPIFVSPSMPRMDFTIANANNVVQKTQMMLLTIGPFAAYTTAHGTYDAGTAGNVTTKRDFVHNIIYTTAGPATGDGWLDYAYKVNPTITGATSRTTGFVGMTANAPLVQQPVTYQWWVNGVVQGPPSGSSTYSQSFGKTISTVGPYTFTAVVIDKRNTSYTLTRTVIVSAPVSCAPQRKCLP